MSFDPEQSLIQPLLNFEPLLSLSVDFLRTSIWSRPEARSETTVKEWYYEIALKIRKERGEAKRLYLIGVAL